MARKVNRREPLYPFKAATVFGYNPGKEGHMNLRVLACAGIVAAASGPALRAGLGQAGAAVRPQFEAASVKLNKNDTDPHSGVAGGPGPTTQADSPRRIIR